jgi:hypothetical protein
MSSMSNILEKWFYFSDICLYKTHFSSLRKETSYSDFKDDDDVVLNLKKSLSLDELHRELNIIKSILVLFQHDKSKQTLVC